MNKKILQGLIKFLQAMGDMVFITAALILAYYVRFYAGIIPLTSGIPPVKYYYIALPVVLVVILLSMNYAGLYREARRLSGLDEFLNIVLSVSAGTVILIAATFFIRDFTYSRVVIVLMWAFSIIIVEAWRIIYRSIRINLSKREYIIQRIIVAGATDVSKMLVERLNRTPGMGYRIVGYVDNKLKKGKKIDGVPVLGKIKDLTKLIKKEKIDEIFVGLSDYDRKEMAEIIMENEKTRFMIVSDVLSLITKSIDYDEIFGIPVFSVRELPLNKMRNRFIKRTFDIISSLLGLIILLPLFIIVALLIKAGSKGPVFYRQARVGRDNREFKLCKFRTMKQDAEKKSGPVWAKEDDPRRTKLGAFLRKSSIDELPQLINILKGEMSVVGPRPERPHFVKKFRKTVPRYIERHKVKAGLTGWAQVHGLRGNTSIEERVRYDLYYIENWSMMLEIRIIIRTILEVFHHTSAY